MSHTCSDQGSADAFRAPPTQNSGNISISTPVDLVEAQKTHLVTKDTSLLGVLDFPLMPGLSLPNKGPVSVHKTL